MTTFPNTRAQRILARLFACGSGRRWVGNRTLQQAWDAANTTTQAAYMRWLAYKLHGYAVIDSDTLQRVSYLNSPNAIRKVMVLPSQAEMEAMLPVRYRRRGDGYNDYSLMARAVRRAA